LCNTGFFKSQRCNHQTGVADTLLGNLSSGGATGEMRCAKCLSEGSRTTAQHVHRAKSQNQLWIYRGKRNKFDCVRLWFGQDYLGYAHNHSPAMEENSTLQE
jgi:hypothetical protein